MKIVILDGYALNPGDIGWSAFEKLGELTIYDRTPVDKIIERTKGFEIVITNKTPMGKEQLVNMPDVKYIGLLSTGYNIVDLEYASQRGIVVTNVPAYSSRSVAQLVFSYVLHFCNGVALHSETVHNGEWTSCKDFCYWKHEITELDGKVMGLFGYGSIGKCVASIAKAFGMRVIVHTRTVPTEKDGCEFVSKEELFKNSDFLSMHCPLTPETTGIINKENLSLMKNSSYIINTARGPVVNEQDLAEALRNGIIAGAAMDVLSTEPPKADNPLIGCKNCVITPHYAWASVEARTRLMNIAASNLESFLMGDRVNMVNK